MPIQTKYPGCGTSYNLADALIGKSVRCKSCKIPFAVQPGIGTVIRPAQSSATLWRHGNLLVFNKDIPFPEICLKSNQPATRKVKQKIVWGGPDGCLLFVLGLPIYLLISVMTTKSATVYLPLSEKWYGIRKKRIAITWGLVLLGISMIVAGINFPGGPWSLFGFVIFLIGLGYGLSATRFFRVSSVKDDFVFLKGAGEDFLANLPEVPDPSSLPEAPPADWL